MGTKSYSNIEIIALDFLSFFLAYTKFQSFFNTVDVCGLYISQKIYLCQVIFPDVDSEALYIDEYSDGKCSKIFVEGFTQNLVSAIQCPPTELYEKDEKSDLWLKKYSTTLNFLTKSAYKNHFVALELSKSTCKIDSQVFNVKIELLHHVRQIERGFKNRPQIDDTKRLMSIKKGNEEEHKFIFRIGMNRKMAEEYVEKLARIKNSNLGE